MNAPYENRLWPFVSHHLYNYEFAPHLHNQIEIIYIVRGSCMVTIDDTTMKAHAGELFLIFPYRIHNFTDTADCEVIVQVFEPEYAPEYIPYLSDSVPQSPLVKSPGEDCVQAIYKAEQYYLDKAPSRVIKAYVALYMNLIFDQLQMVPAPVQNSQSTMHALLTYVSSHYTEDLSLEILAEKLHVTPYYISRIFNKVLHVSFPDYVNHMRLDYAAELLRSSDLSVSEISYQSGFPCERTFYRVFRQTYHTTPLKYRKK